MKPLSTHIAFGAMLCLTTLLLAGCSANNDSKPIDKQQMKKALYGVPLPPDAQAKLNAQGAALAAKNASMRAAAAAHPNTTPPAGASH